MFLRYFVEVPLPAARVETLLERAGAWLPMVVADANQHGHALLTRVGMSAGGEPARGWLVELGRAVRFPSKLALPISWRPASEPGLLPALEAEIEVGTLGPGDTQLSINGRYTPPQWLAGTTADRLLLHRVAEATLKRFLDEVASRLLAGRNGQAASTEAQGSNGGARPDW
jgi:hypothetical protein